MSRWHSYLKTAAYIINAYHGKVPLADWLKDFFRANKQMGSTDRKITADLLYNYYRLGQSVPKLPPDEKLLLGSFLSSAQSATLLEQLRPAWLEASKGSLEERIRFVRQELPEFDPEAIFPWTAALGQGVDVEQFNRSFLVQPDLFLRLRPGHEATVKNKLVAAGQSFTPCGEDCLSMPNATRLNDVIRIDEEAVIQDYNSQRVGSFIRDAVNAPGAAIWDCCAGSGGKSIMAHDVLPGIRLTVSDVRVNILQNLRERFVRAGISGYMPLVVDLSLTKPDIEPGSIDCVIADLPCTGSGTWSRTPEQLLFFYESRIEYYTRLQQRIVQRVIPAIKPGGSLVYITCSVFAAENEAMVEHIVANYGLRVQRQELLTGYGMKADSLFAALLVKD